MLIPIRGRWYRVQFYDAVVVDGSACHGATSGDGPPVIPIERSEDRYEVLGTIIHEALHELCPYLSEDEVAAIESSLIESLKAFDATQRDEWMPGVSRQSPEKKTFT